MVNLSKPESAPTLVSDPSDIRIGELLAAIDGHREKPLIFSYGGRPVRAGYHVTEVKAANFSALDCGANPEAWSEIFVQLWDVDEGERVHMTAGKFAAIIRKVTEHVLLDDTAQLTFEVSDGVAPFSCTGLHCRRSEKRLSRSSFRHGRRAASHATAGWLPSRRRHRALEAEPPRR